MEYALVLAVLQRCTSAHTQTLSHSLLLCVLSLQVLHTRYPDMMAVDIDQRAIQLLTESLPGLNLVHSDVLQIDYTQVLYCALS
jgi:hypothetical protein